MTTKKISYSILILVAVALIAVGSEALYMGYFTPATQAPSGERDLKVLLPHDLVAAKRSNDLQAAIDEYESILNDPQKGGEEKAIATLNAVGVRFHATGNPDAWLEEVRDLKAIAIEEIRTKRTRAAVIAALAMMYNSSGKDPRVFAEIYNDAPFDEYLVPNDPDLSAARLAEWSYSLRPTSVAAVYAAQLYAGSYLRKPDLPKADLDRYMGLADKYLKEADKSLVSEEAMYPNYMESDRYLIYRTWKAIATGFLAGYGMSPYTTQFRSEYENFFEFVKTQKSAHAVEENLFVRWQYARALMNMNETESAKTQFDRLAQDINALQVPNSSSFASFLSNEKKHRSTGRLWATILKGMEISPDFKAVVEKLVTTP